MPRQTRQEIDDEIVEHAAALFARHGFKDTSVQRIADAAGYSKTGLLHRFPNKEALWDAAIDCCAGAMREVAETAAAMPDGPERDRAVIERLVDLALASPGLASLALSFIGGPGEEDQLEGIARPVMTAFGVLPGSTDVGRVVRVIAAAGALAVTSVALSDAGNPFHQLRDDAPGQVRDHLVAAIYDALGHPR